MAKLMKQTITIKLTGKEDGDIELALDMAVRGIKQGNVEGFDKNDDGSYYFRVKKS